ncbi:hypothetical protein [Nocardioides sp. J9]|nr:hypothetical protein [Nocardioides sp. J9]
MNLAKLKSRTACGKAAGLAMLVWDGPKVGVHVDGLDNPPHRRLATA